MSLVHRALAVLMLVGCGSSSGDGDPVAQDAPSGPITFTTARDAQLFRAYEDASGITDSFFHHQSASTSVVTNASACPRTSVDGNTITLSGPCNGPDGDFAGTITIVNYPINFMASPHYDASQPSTTTIVGYRSGSVAIDGTFTSHWTGIGGQFSDPYMDRYDDHFTWEAAGRRTQVDATATIDPTGKVHVTSGALAFADLGSATFTGGWTYGAPGKGSLVVHVADSDDTVTFDLAHATDGCIAFSTAPAGRGAGTACGQGPDVLPLTNVLSTDL